jgi:pyrroline-5-carboxylate reductase
MNDKPQTCFIGAGSMAEAILCGLLENTDTRPHQIRVINRTNTDRLRELEQRYQLLTANDKEETIRQAKQVILAVKPKDMADAIQQWGSCIHSGQTVISVAAGIPTSFIESLLPQPTAVIRAMPNTSSMIGRSATALCKGQYAQEADLEVALRIFSAIGSAIVVEEDQMDTVTGLSGSGPAYIYYLVEALEQAGIDAGLTRTVARELTLQTLLGAAHMLVETGEEPAELRRKVTSPGGTTMAGLQTLVEHRFEEAVAEAVHSAKKRAQELGRSMTALSR